MKSKLIIFVLGALFVCTGSVFASEGHDHSGHKGSMMEDHGMMGHEEAENESNAVEIGNKICPVSGEKVGGAMGDPVKFEYKGKIYNLCCAMCAKDFKKDPEKYVKIVEEEMKQYEKDHDDHDEESEEDHKH